MKSGMSRGPLPREVEGSNSSCAGSCSCSVKPSKMGSAKESMRDLSSDWTTGSCWRLFKVGFATELPLGVVVVVVVAILGAFCCVDSRCSFCRSSLVREDPSSSCKLRFRISSVAPSFTEGFSALKLVGVRSFIKDSTWLSSRLTA